MEGRGKNGNTNTNANGIEKTTFGRFLGWVNADEGDFVEDFDEEDDDHDDHDDHDHDDEHEDDHDDEHEEDLKPMPDDALLEDYEGDDEFDYPDEIIVSDDAPADDGEIDYADSLPIQNVVHLTKKQKMRMRRFRAFYLLLSGIVAINVIGVLLVTVNYLPTHGGIDNPAVNEVYTRYVVDSVTETGALNIVAAVLYSYRSFDTLGEAFVLFTAAIGVIILLREVKEGD